MTTSLEPPVPSGADSGAAVTHDTTLQKALEDGVKDALGELHGANQWLVSGIVVVGASIFTGAPDLKALGVTATRGGIAVVANALFLLYLLRVTVAVHILRGHWSLARTSMPSEVLNALRYRMHSTSWFLNPLARGNARFEGSFAQSISRHFGIALAIGINFGFVFFYLATGTDDVPLIADRQALFCVHFALSGFLLASSFGSLKTLRRSLDDERQRESGDTPIAVASLILMVCLAAAIALGLQGGLAPK